jgi:integrase
MASLVTTKAGLRRIEFGPQDDRRIIRLGRMPAKTAQTFKAYTERIIANNATGTPHDDETARWLATLDEKHLAKLRKVGLADGVGLATVALRPFLDRCLQTLGEKASTKTFYGHTRRNLLECFGATHAVRDIGTADADAFRSWLSNHEELAPATVARRVTAARSMWRLAVRWGMASQNPFEGVRGGHQTNQQRLRFVSSETIEQVMEAAPDAEWRAIIALARYAGLRTPSETYELRWGDIDWERGRLTITCPKLEHIEGHGTRIVPLFPELRKPLLDLFAEADSGGEYVIARHRGGSTNLRTHFQRIIRRAGIVPWPKPFQNLRASRETELMREYDLATVCRWIGNSPAVAANHYATSVDLDADFARAAGKAAAPVDPPEKAQQKAQWTTSVRGDQRMTVQPSDSTQPLATSGVVNDRHAWSSVDLNQDWARRDSNPHVLNGQGILSPRRLPIPPLAPKRSVSDGQLTPPSTESASLNVSPSPQGH